MNGTVGDPALADLSFEDPQAADHGLGRCAQCRAWDYRCGDEVGLAMQRPSAVHLGRDSDTGHRHNAQRDGARDHAFAQPEMTAPFAAGHAWYGPPIRRLWSTIG
jgi:hypothetical protein